VALPSTLNDRDYDAYVELGSTGVPARRVVLYAADGSALFTTPSAMTDDEANPTLGRVAVYLKGYDGATWDRVQTGSMGADSQPTSGVLQVRSQILSAAGARIDSADQMSDGNGGGRALAMHPMVYNGTSFDRRYNNQELTLLTSAARTATTASAAQTNRNGRTGLFILDVTAAAGGGETLQLQVRNRQGAVISLATFATLTATGTYVYAVGLGAVDTLALAGLEVQAVPLPRSWDANVVHSAAGSWTYALYACVFGE
jgi:hypothetical protein